MLHKHDLQLENIRGQGYDGAASMSGQYSGLQSRIAAENEKAIYVHCHAHILNLVLVDACSKNPITRDFFGTVQSLYEFFCSSSKRHAIFMKAQEEPTQSRSSVYQILVGLVEFRSLRVSYPTLITALETAIE